MTSKRNAIRKFVRCLGADRWDIRAIPDKDSGDPCRYNLGCDSARLISEKEIAALGWHNCQGRNIYCRPVLSDAGQTRWLLLDDVPKSQKKALKERQACALVCTSKGNLQAWFRLKEPVTREVARAMCLNLCATFGADLRAANNPDQVGRLPGFTNRKPKRVAENAGVPPLCVLVFGEGVDADIPIPAVSEPSASPLPPVLSIPKNTGLDRSAIDWFAVRRLIEGGMTDENALVDWMLHNSEKGRCNSYYCQLTVSRALAARV